MLGHGPSKGTGGGQGFSPTAPGLRGRCRASMLSMGGAGVRNHFGMLLLVFDGLQERAIDDPHLAVSRLDGAEFLEFRQTTPDRRPCDTEEL